VLTVRRVLRRFERVGPVLDLTVNGRVIGTTHEHPFFVRGRGWTKAQELRVGDDVRLLGPGWATVEAVTDTGRLATVYNLEIEDDHTYFVGCQEWGFSVWAHNAECATADIHAVLALEGKKVNSTVASKIGNAIRKDQFDTATGLLGKNGLSGSGAEFAQRVQAYRALRETGMSHAEVGHYFQTLGDVQVFRGTTTGFAGHGSKLGPTPVSIDPARATAFATEAAGQGAGASVLFGSRANFGGRIGTGNRNTPFQVLEREVSLPMTPSEFAAAAPHAIPVSRAREILSGMGIDVYQVIRGKFALQSHLEDLPRMTPAQIQQFINVARGG
jgi:hypothetical protein